MAFAKSAWTNRKILKAAKQEGKAEAAKEAALESAREERKKERGERETPVINRSSI
tara:strand:+ start:797 stop:964 length:168 start_codon:yes stop_codon:yes gene_type:complete